MSELSRIYDLCLQITESIDLIQTWSTTIQTPEDFLRSPSNVLIFDACIMRLQVIGESIKKLDAQPALHLAEDYPSIPWRKIIALRNIISHEYANIEEAIIFAVIKQSLEPLKTTVSRISNQLK